MAATIAAMALGATFKVIGDSAARERAVEARLAAVEVAQSELADIGAEIPLTPGDTDGVAGTLAWRVEIEPYADASEDSDAGRLLQVFVSVRPRAGGAKLVELTTLRVASNS
ncbi:MAG TPA: hypothetical protein VG166_01720 [Caulobacteraceae bacterium]|nr:hypothetical protein [Caulobacteraceae bacterium]